MATPNVSRWNIGGVGSPVQNSRVGHVDFILFVSPGLGSQNKHNFQWNIGLSFSHAGEGGGHN